MSILGRTDDKQGWQGPRWLCRSHSSGIWARMLCSWEACSVPFSTQKGSALRWILFSSPPAVSLSSPSGTKLCNLLAEEPGTKATTCNVGQGFIGHQNQKGKSTCSMWAANSTARRKELIRAANIGSYTDNKLDWPFSWHHTSIKNFLTKCHFQSCSFKKKKSL